MRFYISKAIIFLIINLILITSGISQNTCYLIKAKQLFDGQQIHSNWAILVEGKKIKAVGKEANLAIAKDIKIIDLGEVTLLPGLIEGHAHILLHPYNETNWNDQVLKESYAERILRAGNHVKATLMAGFTTIRDLGSEGAGYSDVGIKQAIYKGVIPGPKLIVAGPAIVANGSYGPKGFADQVQVPLGAELAGGYDNLIKVVRDQIGKGVDVIKVYADYRWGPNKEAMPTFTQQELNTIVEVANSSGRPVAAHAATEEGMRRAILAGVETIEHGDAGTKEIFELMHTKGVALCPTLAAGDAILQYRGWKKGTDPKPERIIQKQKSFQLALAAGVKIIAGGDVGVFTHGDNVRELEMMVEYGMSTMEVLKSVTSANAKIFHQENKIGSIKQGLAADIIAVDGDPTQNISALRKVIFVMKDGEVFE